MPRYDYRCAEGHVNELRRGYEDDIADCPDCLNPAVRAPFSQDQYLVTETGMKMGRRGVVPPDQVNLKPVYTRFQDASHELDHRSREGDANPRLWKRGVRKAKELAAAGVTVDQFRRGSTA